MIHLIIDVTHRPEGLGKRPRLIRDNLRDVLCEMI